MTFQEAYYHMLKGRKIKRPCFKGYWYIDGYTGKTCIMCRNGEIVTDNADLTLTLTNVMAEDWLIME